jgi:hypothetical protein
MSAVAVATVLDVDVEVEDRAAAVGPPTKKRGGGPKTPEGRFRCSKNAVKDSLRSRVHLPEEERAAIARHLETMSGCYAPADDQERWWVGKMSVAAARLDRCQALMPADLARLRHSAVENWDLDRQAYVEQLAARLPREPRRVCRALLGSLQGVRYLKEHWEMLQDVLSSCGTLTEDQYTLALNLLGVPPVLRVNNHELPAATDTDGLTDLAEAELTALVEWESDHESLDGRFRELAVMGLPLEEDAITRRLRRAESEAKRDLNRALGELLRLQSVRRDGDGCTSPATSTSIPSSSPRDPDRLPALPSRPEAKGRAQDFLHRYEELYPPPTEEWMRLTESRTPEAPEIQEEPEPEPEPEPKMPMPVQPQPESRPALAPVVAAAAAPDVVAPKANARPMDQDEYTRRNRRRRRMLEQLEQQKARNKGR